MPIGTSVAATQSAAASLNPPISVDDVGVP